MRKSLDQQVRKLASSQDKSLNQLILEMFSKALGLNSKSAKQTYDDLDFLIGTWQEDPEAEKVFAEQNLVEPDHLRMIRPSE